MTRTRFIVLGCAGGVFVWAVVAWVLFTSGRYDSVFYRTLQVVSWVPDQTSRWVTEVIVGGPVEAGAFVFLPISLAYWVCIGAAIGASASLVRRFGSEVR